MSKKFVTKKTLSVSSGRCTISYEFDHTELRGACASSETIDLRTLEFGLTSTRCQSTTSERVTHLHILVPSNNSWYARASPRVKKDKQEVTKTKIFLTVSMMWCSIASV